jgi:hypothetical protein
MIPVENHHAIRMLLGVGCLISIRLFVDVDPCILDALMLTWKEPQAALNEPPIDDIRFVCIEKYPMI